MKTGTRIAPQIRKAKALCWELIARAQVSAGVDDRQELVYELRRAIKQAIRFDLLEPTAIMAQYLAHYFYNEEKHHSLGKKFTQLAKKYRHLSQLEANILIDLQPLRYELNKKMAPSKGQIELLQAFVERVEPLLSHNSPTLSGHIYMPVMLYYKLIGEPEKTRDLCLLAIEQLEPLGWQHHYYNILSQIQLERGAFESACQSAAMASRMVPSGSTTFCYYRISEIKAMLYLGQYESAYDLFQKTKWGKSGDPKIKEFYYILKGYFNFLLPNISFGLGRYLNEVIIYQQDKAGLNINTLIIYYLYYLQKDRGKLVDFHDSLERYLKRHTSGRSRYFLRILCALIRFDFKPAVVELRMRKDFEKLEEMQGGESEFIPYETLWEIVVLSSISPR